MSTCDEKEKMIRISNEVSENQMTYHFNNHYYQELEEFKSAEVYTSCETRENLSFNITDEFQHHLYYLKDLEIHRSNSIKSSSQSSTNLMECSPDSISLNQPSCKICFDTENIVHGQICLCRGSVDHICYECISNIFLLKQQKDGDIPICSECHHPYENLQYAYRRSKQTFSQWLRSNNHKTYCDQLIRLIFCLLLAIFSFLCGLSPNVLIYYIYIAKFFAILFLLISIYFLFDMIFYYYCYRNRPKNEIYIIAFDDIT